MHFETENDMDENQIESRSFVDKDPLWCLPFNVNEIEDFLTENQISKQSNIQTPTRIAGRKVIYNNNDENQWFHP